MISEVDEAVFLTADKFWHEVEEIVWMEDISYVEATLKACTKFLLNPEDVYKLKLISPMLKDKIRIEATNDGHLKRQAELPI